MAKYSIAKDKQRFELRSKGTAKSFIEQRRNGKAKI